MRDTGVITQRRFKRAVNAAARPEAREAVQPDPRAVLLRLRARRLIEVYGAGTVRSGGLRVYTTIVPRYQRIRGAGDQGHAEPAHRPGGRADLHQPADGRDPRDGCGHSEPAEQPVQPRLAGASAAGLDLQDVRSRGRDRDGREPGLDVLRLGARSSTRSTRRATATTGGGACPRTRTTTTGGARSGARPSARTTRSTPSSRSTSRAKKVADVARRMGVRSPLDVKGAYVPSIGLGSVAVSPLDLASAYATIAANGVYAEPMAIRQVVLADGREDKEAGWGKPKRRRAISEGTAAMITRILEQNMQSGTGTRAAFGRPAAGKTGTNEEHKDAWFAGYTPDLATTTWIGYTRAEIPMKSVHGIAVSGGSFPAEIWRLFMESALEDVEPSDVPGAVDSGRSGRPFTRRDVRVELRPRATSPARRRDDRRAARKRRPAPPETNPTRPVASLEAGRWRACARSTRRSSSSSSARARFRPSGSSLAEAPGRVVAEPALARVDLPPFASSAMDGFAVRAEDTPGRLPIAVADRGGQPAAGTASGRLGSRHRDGRRGSGRRGRRRAGGARRRGRWSRRAPGRGRAAGAHISPRGGDVRAGRDGGVAGDTLSLRPDRRARGGGRRRGRLRAAPASGRARDRLGAPRPRRDARAGPDLRVEPDVLAAVLATAGAEVVELPSLPRTTRMRIGVRSRRGSRPTCS